MTTNQADLDREVRTSLADTPAAQYGVPELSALDLVRQWRGGRALEKMARRSLS